ncbi:MAG: nitroreductase/quinone reductase family protein [Acidimicrobiia bacterium]
MTDSATLDVRLPDDKPPAWANSLMKWALTTRGLQKMVGHDVALLTFAGRKSGDVYTVPVSYHREGETVTVVTKRARKWWHNFETPTNVEIRLAGVGYDGTAVAVDDEGAALDFMSEFLERRPVDAKAYGLAKEEMTREKIARIIPHIVLIRITIDADD